VDLISVCDELVVDRLVKLFDMKIDAPFCNGRNALLGKGSVSL